MNKHSLSQFFSSCWQSIGRRFFLYILLFSSAVTILSTAVQLYYEYKRDLKNIDANLIQIERSYLQTISEGLWSFNERILAVQLQGILDLPDMRYVEIRQEKSLMMSAGDPVNIKQKVILRDYPLLYQHRGKEMKLAVLHVVVGLDGVYHRLVDRVMIILVTQGFKTFFVSSFVFILFQFVVGRHLKIMANYARKFDLNQPQRPLELARLTKYADTDEIGTLVNAINEMRQNLLQNIEERKKTDQALQESEQRYRSLFSNKHTVMLVINPDDGAIKDANPAAEAYYGWSINDLKRKNISDINTLTPAQVKAEIELARLEKRTHFVFRHRRAQGEPRDVEVYSGPIQQGEQTLLYSIVIDITQRKQAEEQLVRAKEEWEHTFDAISDIITIQDKDMHIVRANKAAHDFFQTEPEELNGKHCYEVLTGVSAPCSGCPLVETLQDREGHSAIITHKNLGKTFQVSSAIIPAENGDILYIVHVAKDITEQKKMEEELFQAQKMEAMGTLAGGIAHDFNNILAAILGFSEFVKRDLPRDSKARQDIEQVISSGQRAAELVKQILTFSRKADQKRHPFQPHLIIKEALKMLRSTLPTTIAIEEHIDPKCGSILANPTNIHQIVMNLCTNAYHAMENEKGTLTVSLSRTELRKEDIAESDVSPGPFIELSIQDTGQGMDTKTMARIFEPYFTTKDTGKGTGLGLAVIHGIVKTLHGFIQVESELGKGSTFQVYIPALEEVAATSVEIEQKSIPMGTERILVVDDESSIVNLHKRVLELLGYTATATTSSKEALEKIRLNPDQFDLLITDQTMPELSGVELAEEVLKIKPNMPIILCTGYSSVITEEGALAIGIKKYARKPLDRPTLAKIVRQVLDDNEV